MDLNIISMSIPNINLANFQSSTIHAGNTNGKEKYIPKSEHGPYGAAQARGEREHISLSLSPGPSCAIVTMVQLRPGERESIFPSLSPLAQAAP